MIAIERAPVFISVIILVISGLLVMVLFDQLRTTRTRMLKMLGDFDDFKRRYAEEWKRFDQHRQQVDAVLGLSPYLHTPMGAHSQELVEALEKLPAVDYGSPIAPTKPPCDPNDLPMLLAWALGWYRHPNAPYPQPVDRYNGQRLANILFPDRMPAPDSKGDHES